jgi:spore coat assembly protein
MGGRKMVRVGDIVARKSYGYDVLFRVVGISEGEAQLKGVDRRLWATAAISDLVIQSQDRITEDEMKRREALERSVRQITRKRSLSREKMLLWCENADEYELRSGSILHLDGDGEYSQRAQEFYQGVGLKAVCVHVQEKEQASQVPLLLAAYRPDVLVLTGHDGRVKHVVQGDDLKLYHTSAYFAKAVREARKHRPAKDDLLIIAGACQSHYQVLMQSGATYASSPGRILIDLYDPCIVACELGLLSAREFMDPCLVVRKTSMGAEGMGGIECQGRLRLCYPVEGCRA